MKKVFNFIYNLILVLLIYIFCGITYDMYKDTVLNLFKQDKIYYIQVYIGTASIVTTDVKTEPITKNNEITFINKNGNKVKYGGGNCTFYVEEVKNDKDLY